ncbi:sigma-54-dependent Fis family transcriptional regulator [bacterium]|nr:sigma-54-dependent Fis family transcriptional regulator [bacterium]
MPQTKASILIVDDEPIKRSVLEDQLRDLGYDVTVSANPLEAGVHLRERSFDVILTDLRMPGQDGISFLRDIRRDRPDQAVILMTGYGTVETAVEAMKLGAFDYVQKPFATEELLLKLDRLLRFEGLSRENEALRNALYCQTSETQVVGRSEAIRYVLARIHAVAGTDCTVLVTGESGTGKELVSRVIHETSYRCGGPFIAVSCAALPSELVEAELFGHEVGAFTGATRQRLGRFELADGGTLLLDDVDDIPLDVQPKLLRAIQERCFERVGGEKTVHVNIRVIATSKCDLATLVAVGRFREDLYYRMNVVPLQLPPVRERAVDVPLLVDHFLRKTATRLNRDVPRIAPEAMAKLQAYPWPGNVRQLEHFVEQLVAMSTAEEVGEADLPELTTEARTSSLVTVALECVERVDLAGVLAEVEERVIRWALGRADGNLARAADLLDVPRSTLQYKISKLDNHDSQC